MRKDIRTYVDCIVRDNREYIKESGLTVAEYLIASFDSSMPYFEFLSDAERDLLDAMDYPRPIVRSWNQDIVDFITENYNYGCE